MMENSSPTIFALSIDWDNLNIQMSINLVALIIIILVIICSFLIIKYFRSHKIFKSKIQPTELNIEMGGISMKYLIQRNYVNVEIAYRIYIELVTRKAAILFDENHDLICETYDSWYSLFQITRTEIKNLTGDLLGKDSSSNDLIELTTDILNKGLRPHLTKYQAKFRKWFNEENKKRLHESPQTIQKDFPEYNEMVKSLKEVNFLMIDYSEKLKSFISG